MFNFVGIFFLVYYVTADYLLVERCKPLYSRWFVNGTSYTALLLKKELYAYPICKVGYSISSAAKVRCVDGWWEKPLPQCEKIESQMCTPLSSPLHGKVNCEEGAPSVGKSCNFGCNKEYTLTGSLKRTCNKDLQWTGVATKCISEKTASHRTRKTCNTLPPFENGIKDCGKGALFIGKSCIFTCHKGYKLDGPAKRTCHSNLRWTEGRSQCILEESKTEKKTPLLVSHLNNRGESSRVRNNTRNHSTTSPCDDNNGGCDHKCEYESGFIQCSCKSGFFSDSGKNCLDMNECGTNNGGCNHFCQNTQGSYYCSCSEGFRLNVDAKTCIDIDECAYGNYCRHQCINTPGSYNCLCNKGFILKDKYFCEDMDECATNKGGCSHLCQNTHGSYYCSCPKGFRLNVDAKTCIDVNECQFRNQNRCNQRCNNTSGGYSCSCEPGFILKNDYECEGCRKNSYRSETDTSCKECPPNSFTDSEAKVSIVDCKCNSGFIGDPKRSIPCEDINECFSDNFGCSHTCVNTPGGAHCSCPPGFELTNDNKTCVDTDECRVKNGGCQMQCQNTIGSFSCSCSKGYNISADRLSCKDIDECEIENGYCSHICINTPGGFYCSCPENYHLSTGGKTCTNARCPSLAIPRNTFLECKFLESGQTVSKTLKPKEENSSSHSSPTDFPIHSNCRIKCHKGYNLSANYKSIFCLEDGNWNASVPKCTELLCPPLNITSNVIVHPKNCVRNMVQVKQQCHFSCRPGYEMVGKKRILTCKNDLTWNAETPSCEPIKTSVPFVICSEDVKKDLLLNENQANVSIPRPKSNIEAIEIFPKWVEAEKPILFPSGITEVAFKVFEPDSNSSAQCIVTVTVKDKQPPVFHGCPESFEVGNAGSQGVLVTWYEPIAVDNVGVASFEKNLEPNSTFIPGIHFVEYVAEDAAGNKAYCSFQINVTRGYCGRLKDPENGTGNCREWSLGKLCKPQCEPGYERDQKEPKYFACGETGVWTPTDTISPCLPKCVNGTVWSSTSDGCEEA